MGLPDIRVKAGEVEYERSGIPTSSRAFGDWHLSLEVVSSPEGRPHLLLSGRQQDQWNSPTESSRSFSVVVPANFVRRDLGQGAGDVFAQSGFYGETMFVDDMLGLVAASSETVAKGGRYDSSVRATEERAMKTKQSTKFDPMLEQTAEYQRGENPFTTASEAQPALIASVDDSQDLRARALRHLLGNIIDVPQYPEYPLSAAGSQPELEAEATRIAQRLDMLFLATNLTVDFLNGRMSTVEEVTGVLGYFALGKEIDLEVSVNVSQGAQLSPDRVIDMIEMLENARRAGVTRTRLVINETETGDLEILFLNNGKGIPPAIGTEIFDEDFTTGGTGKGLSYIWQDVVAGGRGEIEFWTFDEEPESEEPDKPQHPFAYRGVVGASGEDGQPEPIVETVEYMDKGGKKGILEEIGEEEEFLRDSGSGVVMRIIIHRELEKV